MNVGRKSAPWTRRLSGMGSGGRIRLFCFPYAGGGASTFRSWAELLPEEVDVYAVQPPGREDRLFETPVDDIAVVLREVVPEILEFSSEPFSLFGHSLGAVVCWEVARALRDDHGVEPEHLFLSGCRALPTLHDGRRDLYALSDRELVAALREMNGTPEEILQNDEFMRLFLPAVRADYAMLSRYRFVRGTAPACRATVFGGAEDPAVSREQLERWVDDLPDGSQTLVLPGDHFFLHSSRVRLLSEIGSRLSSAELSA
ncbi:thioesterase II family protein [Streptomyces sp. NPDC017936]|uniref:thioesterase II family protein n=1 Tax=Streptomyces sp. NPDC017936 TaxID=3365016 RepID=UPI0037AA6158